MTSPMVCVLREGDPTARRSAMTPRNPEVELPDHQLVPLLEYPSHQPLTVYVGSVRRAKVRHRQAGVVNGESYVLPRHGDVWQEDRCIRASPGDRVPRPEDVRQTGLGSALDGERPRESSCELAGRILPVSDSGCRIPSDCWFLLDVNVVRHVPVGVIHDTMLQAKPQA